MDPLVEEAQALPPVQIKPTTPGAHHDPTPPINSSRALIAEVRTALPSHPCKLESDVQRFLLPELQTRKAAMHRANSALAGECGFCCVCC